MLDTRLQDFGLSGWMVSSAAGKATEEFSTHFSLENNSAIALKKIQERIASGNILTFPSGRECMLTCFDQVHRTILWDQEMPFLPSPCRGLFKFGQKMSQGTWLFANLPNKIQ